jgi:CRP-like cAMP-binding protein
VDCLRVFRAHGNVCLHHLQNEQAVFRNELRIDEFAFEIGEAFHDERSFDLVTLSCRQVEALKFVTFAPRRASGTNACLARFKVMNDLSDWRRNRLLIALSSANLRRLMPELEQVRCQPDQILMDADSALEHVYFPDNGVISIVAVYSDGSVIEMATIGREGCTGLQAAFGAKRSSVRLLVQLPGIATRMSRSAFIRAMETMPSFRNLMFAYVEAFLEQVLVSVACNGAHNLTQRLARWLLMMRDRSDDDTLDITQNLLAEMLGVHRPSITNAIRGLERAGLIRYGRGEVTILNRPKLMKASCECYRLVRERIAVRLPKTYTD